MSGSTSKRLESSLTANHPIADVHASGLILARMTAMAAGDSRWTLEVMPRQRQFAAPVLQLTATIVRPSFRSNVTNINFGWAMKVSVR